MFWLKLWMNITKGRRVNGFMQYIISSLFSHGLVGLKTDKAKSAVKEWVSRNAQNGKP